MFYTEGFTKRIRSLRYLNMKSFVVVCILFAITVYAADEDEEQWSQYKLQYSKSYETTEEDRNRSRIFKANVKTISEHNERYEKGLETYRKAINKFADLEPDEFQEKYKVFKHPTFTYNDTIPTNASAASEHIDWRDKGVVIPVKNQGTCGACWIFSAVGVMEAYYFKKHSKLIPFSEQYLIDCIRESTCFGGWPGEAMEYVKKHGIRGETDYTPFAEKEQKCLNDTSKNLKVNFSKIVTIPEDEAAMKDAVAKYGPIVATVYVGSEWMFYKSGVWYNKECTSEANHAVMIVGYGTENGNDYWLIKNSMGADWGDGGYIKLARNKHKNYCGIANYVWYVV